jgi:glycosyltransferase involved in cell wall biosynthesis
MLERAIHSVLAQTIDDLEIIVVDDGSAEPHEQVADLDARVRFFRQENRGVSIARNVGALRARSELLAFLDQDDVWRPTKLEAQLEAVESEPDSAFWCTGFEWVRNGVAAPSDMTPLTYTGLLSTQSVLLSSLLVRGRDYWDVGGHDPLLAQMQDWDLFLRLTMSGRVPCLVPDLLVEYHLHGANASADYRTAAAERIAVLDKHRSRARRRGELSTLRAVERGVARTRELFAYQAVDAARVAAGRGDARRVVSHLAFASRSDPSVAVKSAGKALRARLSGSAR